MKVLYFGLPRAPNQTLASHQELFKALGVSSENIFCSFIDEEHIYNPRSGENTPVNKDVYSFFAENNMVLIDPNDEEIVGKIEELKVYEDNWKDGGFSRKNLIKQLYSIKKGVEYFKLQSDVVLYMRPDTIWESNISEVEKIKLFVNKNLSDYILVPSWQWWDGVNDRFAITNGRGGNAFSNRFDNIAEYLKDLRVINSERVLELSVKKSIVDLYTTKIKFWRVRSNGKIHKERFDIFTCKSLTNILKANTSKI